MNYCKMWTCRVHLDRLAERYHIIYRTFNEHLVYKLLPQILGIFPDLFQWQIGAESDNLNPL